MGRLFLLWMAPEVGVLETLPGKEFEFQASGLDL